MSHADYKHRDRFGWPVPTWVQHGETGGEPAHAHPGGGSTHVSSSQIQVAAATLPSSIVHAPAQPPPPPAPPPTIGVVAQ